jgi:hypothetical protein
MTEVPEPTRKAALIVLHHALVYAPNITIRPENEAARQVNALMEAIHEIPQILMDGNDLEGLRYYLG